MGLEKAIGHGKERRKSFSKETGTYAKSIDYTCRNHGSCEWCLSNRIYKNKKRELSSKEQLKEFIKELYD
ncbi:hypothetical protein MCI89_09620 [Muricomes sp. OA1]|uniref:hypothetical protein n=1 Tax=Muricomes sp. OA1 TaxID=2914165 RepID=UPI0004704BA6|nr:hypothetical protein [Muricomes sp. OA1]MCH1972597.1 hypothetical protein [Muricomes sp. OA1]